MGDIPTTSLGALVVITSGFFGFILKLWNSHTALAEKMLKQNSELMGVLQADSVSREKMVAALKAIEDVTKENTLVTRDSKATMDTVSRLLIDVIKK
jgi:uncharacterized membrane protein YiaA